MLEEHCLDNISMLLVDDESSITELFSLLLEAYGAKVSTASTVSGGFREAEDVQPDIMLCDMGLPDGSGRELLEKVRHSLLEKVRNLPVAAVTGQVTPFYGETLKTGMKSVGFQAFLVKPVDANQLIEMILEVTAGVCA